MTGVKYAFTINAPTIFDQELNRKDSAFTVSTVETFVSDTKVEVWDVRKNILYFDQNFQNWLHLHYYQGVKTL